MIIWVGTSPIILPDPPPGGSGDDCEVGWGFIAALSVPVLMFLGVFVWFVWRLCE